MSVVVTLAGIRLTQTYLTALLAVMAAVLPVLATLLTLRQQGRLETARAEREAAARRDELADRNRSRLHAHRLDTYKQFLRQVSTQASAEIAAADAFRVRQVRASEPEGGEVARQAEEATERVNDLRGGSSYVLAEVGLVASSATYEAADSLLRNVLALFDARLNMFEDVATAAVTWTEVTGEIARLQNAFRHAAARDLGSQE